MIQGKDEKVKKCLHHNHRKICMSMQWKCSVYNMHNSMCKDELCKFETHGYNIILIFFYEQLTQCVSVFSVKKKQVDAPRSNFITLLLEDSKITWITVGYLR